MNEMILPAGFTARPATLDDSTAVTDLLNAGSVATLGTTLYSYEECVQEWSEPGFNLADSSCLIFSPDGVPAAYAEIWDTDSIPVHPFVVWGVHPQFATENNQAVGLALLNWAAARSKRVIERVPADAQVAMVLTAFRQDSASLKLFDALGATFKRSFYQMGIDIVDVSRSEIEWPQEMRLVTFAEYPEKKALYLAKFEAFNDHFGAVEDEDPEDGYESWAHRLSDPDFDPTLWFILLDGDEIAAFSTCWPKADEQHDLGYIRNLGVRRPWRRRGLAQKLLLHSFNVFKARGGFRRVQLSVDAESLTGATRLYEKVGMRVLRENCGYELVLRPGPRAD